MMTQYQKAMLVMDYLRELQAEPEDILEAICDRNLEQSFQLIQENPQITLEELMSKIQTEEED